ncbi:MAG: NADH-quinone oxidoreductase subunit M [Deltaproteobacteria bacterium]|nr:NADH-quinone oxidoreductase subunit M [Deltaproteobacteria bacterium]
MVSAVTFTPLLGALVLLFLKKEHEKGARWIAFGTSLLTFVLSIGLLCSFDSTIGSFQLVERVPWIPDFGIDYHVGIDGISLFLVLLTTFLMPLIFLSAWGDVHKHIKEYMLLFLVLETGMIGAFVAIDLFLFYVFWEVMLIPMYFLIGVWGGARRIYAAIKFLIYTMVGSLLMLVAILYLAYLHNTATGSVSFNLLQLYDLQIPAQAQLWMFAAFVLSFAIKVPLFPFHTWLPDAHVEAPTGGSVILAGVMLKMGTYGLIRFAIPLFPDAAYFAAPVLIILSVVGIFYGALVAMVQPDLKKLVAYSSVSHMGFVVLGLFAFNMQGTQGAVFQMLNHGISTGALFLLVGVVYERRHTRLISEYGGLWKQMPIYATIFLVTMFSSIGLPGLNGFVGEFLILMGAFKAIIFDGVASASSFSSTIYMLSAISGVVLGAVYMLWMYQRVMFGPLENEENKKLADLSCREVLVFAPLLVLMVLMGLFPNPFLSRMEKSVDVVVARMAPVHKAYQAKTQERTEKHAVVARTEHTH